MEENVFMTGGKTLTLEDYLQYDAGSRDNLGHISLAGDGEHTFRFIDDQQIVVLIKDIQLRLPVRVRQ